MNTTKAITATPISMKMMVATIETKIMSSTTAIMRRVRTPASALGGSAG